MKRKEEEVIYKEEKLKKKLIEFEAKEKETRERER
jgi:hypothetical protein